jgi:hypothetical protein
LPSPASSASPSKFLAVNFFRRVLAADFHGHVTAEFGIVNGADDIVERRQPGLRILRADAAREQREILAVRVVVADEVVVNHRFEQAREVDDGCARYLAQQPENKNFTSMKHFSLVNARTYNVKVLSGTLAGNGRRLKYLLTSASKLKYRSF